LDSSSYIGLIQKLFWLFEVQWVISDSIAVVPAECNGSCTAKTQWTVKRLFALCQIFH